MRPGLHRVALVLSLIVASVGARARGQIFELMHSLQLSNGATPYCGLFQVSNGEIYGTAYQGGSGNGAVFKISADGVLSRAASFVGTDGAAPVAEVIQGRDGNLYGTTFRGGFGVGTVLKLTPNGDISRLHSFAGGTNGVEPTAPLIEANDGAFYGTTSGGEDYNGTIFRITTNGVFTTLFSFGFTNGAVPLAGLTPGNDGHFYGTTYLGGPQDGHGTVFRITATGALTTLVTFRRTQATGGNPQAGLLLARDGHFYGATETGGSGGGTIFRMTPEGALTHLVSFSGANGASPRAKLLQASDGYFYGTTTYGGRHGLGTVFRMNTNGVLTTVHNFNNGDGAHSESALIEARDGGLYGTAVSGGSSGRGTVFRIMPLILSATRSRNDFIVSWPTSAVGFIPQSAPGFSVPMAWTNVAKPPSIHGTQFAITNAMTNSAQLFRLRRP